MGNINRINPDSFQKGWKLSCVFVESRLLQTVLTTLPLNFKFLCSIVSILTRPVSAKTVLHIKNSQEACLSSRPVDSLLIITLNILSWLTHIFY